MSKLRGLMLTTVVLFVFATAAYAQRGADGELRMLYWQAPSVLNPFLSGGTKDIHAAAFVIEPLARYDDSANMVPALAAEIPTVENGGVAADLKSVTWKLRKGVTWSDGTPFTAADVAFTAAYCMHPDGGCNAAPRFENVAAVEAVDDHTVRISFEVAMPFPYGPFVGSTCPVIQKKQFEGCMGAKAPECTHAELRPHRHRRLQGEGVPAQRRGPLRDERALPQPGPAGLRLGPGEGRRRRRVRGPGGAGNRRVRLRLEPPGGARDPRRHGKGGQGQGGVGLRHPGGAADRAAHQSRSCPGRQAVHLPGRQEPPSRSLSDPAVRRALSLAIDRNILVEAGYGQAGRVTCNVLPAPPVYASTANDWCKTQDVAAANKLLDEAGWVRGSDGIRAKNGVRLSILYQTSTNSVRQGTQALIKQMWRQIGVETELKNISASVFFGSDPASPGHLPEVLRGHPDVRQPVQRHRSSVLHAGMAVQGDPWAAQPVDRQQHAALLRCGIREARRAELAKTAGIEKRAAIARRLNDMLMDYGALIPLVHRGEVGAHALSLGGVRINAWDALQWNINEWHRRK